MPILPAEPDIYPPDLWEQEETVWRTDVRWWCLHTRPRQEKMLARHLRSLGLCHYLPQTLRKSRTPGGRSIRSMVPLFPGYLFLKGDDFERVEAMKGNHLANMLVVHDQEALDHDLRQIHRMLQSGLAIREEPFLPDGARFRITSGPLQGIVGTVVRRHDHSERFVAHVNFLGRGASLELMDWQVERLDAYAEAARLIGGR